jgi:hypothetical protein
VALLEPRPPSRLRASDTDFGTRVLTRHEFHGEWNYFPLTAPLDRLEMILTSLGRGTDADNARAEAEATRSSTTGTLQARQPSDLR